jgi:N-acetylglucosamine kinase-like BadF-type ATPase
VVDAVYARPPAELGALAPVVISLADEGDAVAAGLVEAAADHLVGTVAVVGEPRPLVVVLSGSLLIRSASIGDRVRSGLDARWPGVSIREAKSGEAGAVALAVRDDTGQPVSQQVLANLSRVEPRSGRARR